MITSLKTRIAVWYISLSTLILVGLGVALYLVISHSMMNERRALIAQDLERLPQVAQRFGNRGVNRFLDEAQEEIPLKPADEFVQIFKPDGVSIATSLNLRGQSLPFRPDLASATSQFATISISGDGSPALLGVTRISINNEPYFAAIAASLGNVRSVQRRLMVTLLISIPVAILLSLVGGAVLARHAIEQPFRRAGVFDHNRLRQFLQLGRFLR